jgi:hypothetical protein
MLVSSISGDVVASGRVTTAKTIFAAHGVVPREVDAAAPANKELRDALFKVSGVRGSLPQIFVHDTAADGWTFISYERLEGAFCMRCCSPQPVRPRWRIE